MGPEWVECAAVGVALRELESLGCISPELEDYIVSEEGVMIGELGVPGLVCYERCRKRAKVDEIGVLSEGIVVIVPVRSTSRLRVSKVMSGKVFLAIITSTKRSIEVSDLEFYRVRSREDLGAERYEDAGNILFAEPLPLRSG